MTLVYSIVSGPMPFKDYSATMVVTADGDRGGIAGYAKALGL